MSRGIWILISAWWLALGVLHFFSLLEFLPFEDIAARRSLAWAAAGFLCSLPLAWLTPRVRRPRGLAGFIALGVVLSAAGAFGVWILQEMVDPFLSPYTSYLFLDSGEQAKLDSPLVFPAASLGLIATLLLLEQRRSLRVQQQNLAEVERQAQRAQLEALRYQLNPHFLFNALNSIGALASEDAAKTQRLVTQLADFLRYSLMPSSAKDVTVGGVSWVTLEAEMDAIRAYLAIEQVRFESDLVVTYEIAPDAAAQRLPAFLLLPLVDNAIKYGQRTSPVPLRLRLAAWLEGGALRIEVANTGSWLDDASVPGTRNGLANVEQRLTAEYPGRHSLAIRSDAGWVCILLMLRGERA